MGNCLGWILSSGRKKKHHFKYLRVDTVARLIYLINENYVYSSCVVLYTYLVSPRMHRWDIPFQRVCRNQMMFLLSLFNVRPMPSRCCDRLWERVTFGSDWDSNRWPPSHDFSSGGDSVYHLSVSASLSFRSNSFTICCSSPMLVHQMLTPEHGD